jgi:hypothetical protein
VVATTEASWVENVAGESILQIPQAEKTRKSQVETHSKLGFTDFDKELPKADEHTGTDGTFRIIQGSFL